ncbi:MAG: adenine phosphoribosyltransferase [Bifidobacteriaceae bacterium]|jgi:adenine phosphoribosyltransferase|nr:adenine phosphoribosyltransferase [Bifidobacteriaceae bacterium]
MVLDSADLTNSGLRIERLDALDQSDADYLVSKIRTIPDFPAKGIMFRDFIPAMSDPKAFAILIEALKKSIPVDPDSFDYVGGLEARGFLAGAPLAVSMEKGFVAFRKAGKLPPPTLKREYDLEYGQASVEIEKNILPKGARVLIVDDLIATGGTAQAAAELVEDAGAEVAGFAFVMELDGLDGRGKLGNYPTSVLIGLPA